MLLIASIVYHLNLTECKPISSSSHHHHHHNSNQHRYNKLSPSTSTSASSTSTTVNWAVFRFDKTTSEHQKPTQSSPNVTRSSSLSSSTSMFVRDLFIESNSTVAPPSTKKYLHDLLESSNSNNENDNVNKNNGGNRVNTQDYFESDLSDAAAGGDHNELRRGECKLKPVEISLRIRNCGRVVLNTTACSGFCKSGEQLLPGTGLKRKYCSSCKPYKFTDISYKVKCTDGSYNTVKLRTVSACSCFKQLDILVPLTSSNKFDNLR